MNNKKIYIIILNWNGTDDTIECIESLLKINYDNYQLILVDNNSEEKNYNYLREWCDNTFPLVLIYSQKEAEHDGTQITEELLNSKESRDKLLVIKNDSNLGFTVGNNVALKYVLSKQEEDNYSLLLNNDTVVEPDFLTHLATFMDKHPKYVACTPQIRLFEPNDEIWNCGGKITWFGNRRYFFAGKKVLDTPQYGYKDIEFITGCALFFKPHVTGKLSDKFFFGEEDFEFSLRMKQQKQKIACVFNSIIYHKVGKSIKKNNKDKLLNRVFVFYASRLIDHKEYYSWFRLFINRILNISYVTYLILSKYRFSLRETLSFVQKLRLFIKINNCVDKSNFKKIMDMKF